MAVRIKPGLNPHQVHCWLLHLGFKSKQHNRYFKGPLRITLKKMVVLVEIKLDNPIHKRIPVYPHVITQHYMRISSAYYKRITVSEDGILHGLGFNSHMGVHRVVYGEKT